MTFLKQFEFQAQGNYVEFHPSGTCFGAALANGVVKVYETRMQKVLQLYEVHQGSVNSFAFHPSGNYIITGSQECTLKILDLMEGRPSYTLYGSKAAVHTVKFNSSGEYFAVGKIDFLYMTLELVFSNYLRLFLCAGGADGEILIWRGNFGSVQQLEKEAEKITAKKKMRASLVTGLNGIDVNKVVGSASRAETNDIEEARPKVFNQLSKEEKSTEKNETKLVPYESDKLVGAAPITTHGSGPSVRSEWFC